MRRALNFRLILLFCAFAFGSPYYSLETLHHDIMNAKLSGGSVYEVKVISVDSIRSIRRFSTGKLYSGESKDSTEGTVGIQRTQYVVQFEVVKGIAGEKHAPDVLLVGVDSRPSAETIWKRIWPQNKRIGKSYIFVLGKNGQIRATYLAESRLSQTDSLEQKMREVVLKEMMAIAKDTVYKDFINRKNYLEILKRENYLVD